MKFTRSKEKRNVFSRLNSFWRGASSFFDALDASRNEREYKRTESDGHTNGFLSIGGSRWIR